MEARVSSCVLYYYILCALYVVYINTVHQQQVRTVVIYLRSIMMLNVVTMIFELRTPAFLHEPNALSDTALFFDDTLVQSVSLVLLLHFQLLLYYCTTVLLYYCSTVHLEWIDPAL
jgi:hypothetical protein